MHKDLSELFVCIRVGETLIPVYVDLTNSEEKFVAENSEGSRLVLADEVFNTKKSLNGVVKKDYVLIVKPTKRKPDDFDSKIRNLFFDKSTYRYRSIGEGDFGALSVEFSERLKSRRKSNKAKNLVRNLAYCIKITLEWKYENLELLDMSIFGMIKFYCFAITRKVFKSAKFERCNNEKINNLFFAYGDLSLLNSDR